MILRVLERGAKHVPGGVPFMSLEKTRWVLLDACLAACSFGLSYVMLAVSFRAIVADPLLAVVIHKYIRQALLMVGVLVAVRVLLFFLFSLYRSISRFAGAHELQQIILSVTCGSVLLALWSTGVFFFKRGWEPHGVPAQIPIPVVAADWLACLVLVGGSRMAWRLWSLSRFARGAAIHNVLIVGATDVGELVARNFIHNPQTGYRPVGYVDDDKTLWRKQIHGLPVYGGVDQLPKLIQSLGVAEVLVAAPKPSLRFLNHVVEVCERAHVGFKIVPAVSDLMSERVSINQIRPVEIEDLLGREPVDLALAKESDYLKDEVVLVTGAGGSIGSELCRQMLLAGPKRLLLLGRGENSIYEIATELSMHAYQDRLTLIIADVQDVERMEAIFERHKPTVVFHAAAHKHVPLMEMHPSEAVKNNVFGTFNVAFLSKKAKVKRFILISTDKAVRPSSVMGATKRVAEMIVSALSRESDATSFLSVRFGNVLGSRGSVVPLFRRQIAAGGPVTVTHPDVERYFMTIPEAVNLVLQAGSIGDNGQLFLLDMGEPVRILSLAQHMIALSGYEPGVDIDIQFTGLRPGEKLKEELLTDNEDLSPTEHHKIFATRVDKPEFEAVKRWLRRFDALISEQREDRIVDELRRIVPEFQPADVEAENAKISSQGSH